MTSTFDHLDTRRIRESALKSVSRALEEKNLPPAYIIGFKGSYAMGLQTADSDLDVIAYVQANVEQEWLFGQRPLSKEFTLEQTETHPAIEVNVQSITHLARSLHKIPFNTVEVFAGTMAPSYSGPVGATITKHVRNVLSLQESAHEYRKTVFFMGHNTFNKGFKTLDDLLTPTSHSNVALVKGERNKMFAKAALFYNMLCDNEHASVFDMMTLTDQRIRMYHDYRNDAISSEIIGIIEQFYTSKDNIQTVINQTLPVSQTKAYRETIAYMVSLI